ncbi:transposase, partial [Escherichia coli]|nr:transposase [Escherichia coli]
MGTIVDSLILEGRRKRRPNFPVAFKRQLAQQANEPGASVSHLAQQHGINANMLF